MTDDSATFSVDELVDYCRTQARFLWGRVESITREADDLLDDIDEGIEEIRTQLAAQSAAEDARPVPSATVTAGEGDATLDAIESQESDLEQKQAIVAAKQARSDAFEALATAYVELADDIETSVDDGQAALTRIVGFERDHDAPAYFEERQTLLEAAAEASTADE